MLTPMVDARPVPRGVTSAVQLRSLQVAASVRLSMPESELAMRGFGRFAKVLGALLPPTQLDIPVHGRSHLPCRSDDHYWVRLLFPELRYEPEVEQVLRHLLGPDAAFVDGGANVGYWSLLALELIDDPRRVLAVEAAQRTYDRLDANLRAHGARDSAIHAALAATDGLRVVVETPTGHASAHVIPQLSEIRHPDPSGRPTDTATEVVTTRSVDSLCRQHLPPSFSGLVVVKLDVEGFESEAIEGCRELMATRPVVLIYEDHGRDRDCSPTRRLLADGFRVFATGRDGRLGAVRSVTEARAAKVSPRHGYNFVACRPEQQARLGSLIAES